MINLKQMAAVSVVCSMFLVGCSGGGGSSASSSGTATTSGSASLSGTLANNSSGAATAPSRAAAVSEIDSEASAQLIVDLNKNGTFGDSKDVQYTAAVSSTGAFSFSNITLDEGDEVEAQLIVSKLGFAPVTKIITLKDGQSASVLAEAGTLPIQVEVVELDRTSPTFKASYLKVGMKSTASGVQSYSKIMSLSELHAEAESEGFGQDGLSESVIPLSAFPEDVTSVQANMQAFDPTNADDSNYFPGEYKGVGKDTSAQSADEERRLVSVAFDLMSLQDQNGDPIELDNSNLSQSKLRPQAIDYSSCLQTKTRYLNSSQVALIESFGDDDPSTTEFEIPMWYYNSQTGIWSYLGQAEYTSAADSANGNAYAVMCVTENWGEYLNLDYDFAIEEPKTVCVDAKDQDGNILSNMTIYSKKDTAYDYKYLDANGETTLGLTAGGTPADYEFYYSAALTGWTEIQVDNSLIIANSTEDECDYDLSLVVENPYTTQLRVTAKEIDGSAGSGYVTVYNQNYADYFYEWAALNEDGVADLRIKPNTPYKVSYSAKVVDIQANGAVVAPETADSTRAVSVTVQDENQAPQVYVSVYPYSISDKAESIRFSASASDANGDNVTFGGLTLNGVTLVEGTHYSVTNNYSYGSYAAIYGTIDLSNAEVAAITPASLNAGDYDLVATFSDSAQSATGDYTFRVNANRAPRVNGLYLLDDNSNYVSQYGTIPVGTYSINAYAYDPDGDPITLTYTVDGNPVSPESVSLTQGEHIIAVTADDGTLNDSESFSIFVGDRAPEISYASTTSYVVDIGAGETFKIIAYVYDQEDAWADLDVNASGEVMTHVGYGRFETADINEMPGELTYEVRAKDTAGNISDLYEVAVTVIESNQVPIFTTQLSSQMVTIGTTLTLECEAYDPEATLITYKWLVDGVEQSATGTEFTQTFGTAGQVTVECQATDGDGEVSTSRANYLAYSASQASTLTINAPALTEVTLHDNLTLEPISEKATNMDGVVTFDVVGDRASFSVTISPKSQVSADTVFDMIQSEIGYAVMSACSEQPDGNATCDNFDYCTFLESDTIPLSYIALDPPRDENDNIVDITPYDLNQDGQASVAEVYAVALALGDENEDGKLTYDEFMYDGPGIPVGPGMGEEQSINSLVYMNLPVGTYTLDYVNMMMDGPYGYNAPAKAGIPYPPGMDECQDEESTPNVALTITDLPDMVSTRFRSYGATSYYGTQYVGNSGGATTLSTTLYLQGGIGDNGSYSFVIYDYTNYPYTKFYPVELTPEQLSNGVTVSYDDFMDATIATYTYPEMMDGETYFQLNQLYNGYSYDGFSSSTSNNIKSMHIFDFPGATYGIEADFYTYDPSQDFEVGVYQNNYYVGALQSDYNISDYPHIDVTASFTENGIELGGSDVSRLNAMRAYTWAYGENYYLNMQIFSTQVPTVLSELNITAILPSSVGVLEDPYEAYMDLSVMELKDMTEADIIELMQSPEAIYDGPINLNLQERGVYLYFDIVNEEEGPGIELAPANNSNNKERRSNGLQNPFAIPVDVSKVWR